MMPGVNGIEVVKFLFPFMVLLGFTRFTDTTHFLTFFHRTLLLAFIGTALDRLGVELEAENKTLPQRLVVKI